MKDKETSGGLRYFSIAQEIRRRLVSGQYTFGTALPSQSALAEEFTTTVMTVRQALKMLEAEGLIEMRHGVGSFVSGLHEDHREFTLSNFRQTLASHAEAVTTEVVFRTRTMENEAAVRALETGGRVVSAIGRRRTLRATVLVFCNIQTA
jgi:GntR family transcriptional regulator